MPKGTGRGGSSKKPSAPAKAEEPESNVIFAHSSKGKKKETGQDRPQDGSKNPQESAEDAVKKPDTRTLIGGASWTGKLPVNLLSEHCQKQKWRKPEYTMSKVENGFSSMVILHGINPKTKEPIALSPFKLPQEYKHLAIQPTAVEARHFAATYAVFRISSMKNIHMMLPPTYKELWKNEFQNLKKEDVSAGRGWMYEADPFTTKVEQDEIHAAAAKRRADLEKQRAKEAQQPHLSFEPGGSRGQQSQNKIWAKAPKIDLGKRTRAQVENTVRQNSVWNSAQVKMSDVGKTEATDELTRLGFRRTHAEEAVDVCKNQEEALEWLLIYVPEDDLPRWCLPEAYTAGLSLASGNLKRDAIIKRLAAAGYQSELCEKVLGEAGDDENLAAETLQTIHFDKDGQQEAHLSGLTLQERNASEAVWIEEGNTLEAIFGDSFARNAHPPLYEITLQATSQSEAVRLQVRRSNSYPNKPPVISVLAATTPAYIRLSITRQAIGFARENTLGEPMIFQIIDWLEAEIPGIIENPGKLQILYVALPKEVDYAKRRDRGKVGSQLPRRLIDQPNQISQSKEILDDWRRRQASPMQSKMMDQRKRLPAWQLKDQIVESVNSHQVTIISGETGSGKSTQSVQFILDDFIQDKNGARANIVCTQPRRISAMGLADRVSEERCSKVGDEIGYSIRGESRHKRGITKITFVTVGVLLRRLQTSGGSKEDVLNALEDTSHVFVDEVHERSLDTDFLLVLLKDVLRVRKDLKIILMSATLDSALFEQYFRPVSSVASVEIPGRTHPVQDFHLDDIIRMTGFKAAVNNTDVDDNVNSGPLDDIARNIQRIGMKINYELIASTVRAIDEQLAGQEGGILVFLPGTMEINWTIDALRSIPNMHALPLHASLTPQEQRRVFPRPPVGKRKVIASTNVAETSITIEDIVAVIDCGRVKETTFDPQNNMVRLEEVWASRAACKQRRGRAGRVQAGVCYKLYTRNAESKMAEKAEPEIRRVPLEQLCLSVRAMGIHDVSGFLSNALTPPETAAVEGALTLLNRMGALAGDDLTALGEHMSMIPADLRCGKLIIYGAIFGCLEACLTIAAILSSRSPFVSPQQKREESKAARASFASGQGDLICDLKAFEEWSQRMQTSNHRELRNWCEANFLSMQTLRDIASNRQQFLTPLLDIGFVSSKFKAGDASPLNTYNSDITLIRALVAGAFSPQIARVDFPDKKFAASHTGAVELDPEARTIKYFNEENGRVFVHPGSTLFNAQTFPGGSAYLSYFTKMATSKIFIRELTPFNSFSALMFGGPLSLDTLGKGIILDGWLRLRGWARIGALVGRLREILDALLARKINDPDLELVEFEVVKTVRHLIAFNGLDQ